MRASDWTCERDILERRSFVPVQLYDEWLDAVMEYINGYNDRLPDRTVRYEITDSRENSMYYSKRYLNNVLVEEGWMDYGMVSDRGDDKELEEWSNSVVNFRKSNGLPLPSDAAKDLMQRTSDIRNNATTAFDDGFAGSLSTIPQAVATLQENPCEFPSQVVQAVQTGPPSVIDNMKAQINTAKEQISQALEISTDDFNTAVGPTMDPVIDAINEQLEDRTPQQETAEEYYRRRFLNEYTVVDQAIGRSEYTGNESLTGTPGQSYEGIAEDYDDILITTSGSNFEIPEWMQKNIRKAMYARWKKHGIPPEDTLERFNTHKDFFISVFNRHNVPWQLMVLSIIESNVKNISTENSCTAKGMWQIIRSTGKQYGLLQTDKYGKIVAGTDKRALLEPSTEAAAKILRNMKNTSMISNWFYTAGSYNCGAGNMQKYIKKAGKSASVWDVWKWMNDQTKNYVAMVIGLFEYLGYDLSILF